MRINNETKVGLMVIVVVALLIGLTIKTGKIKISDEGYHVKVLFSDIDGVNLNSPVMYNGYEVGIVEDIQILETPEDVQMELKLWISDRAKLKKGTKAYVKNLGFMGEKYVGLVSCKGVGKSFVGKGHVIYGEDPPDFGVLFSDAEKVLEEVKGIASNLNERLDVNREVVDDILVNARVTMKNISVITENTSERLEMNDERIDAIIVNLESLSTNFKELSHDLKLHPWKLLHRTKEKKKD